MISKRQAHFVHYAYGCLVHLDAGSTTRLAHGPAKPSNS